MTVFAAIAVQVLHIVLICAAAPPLVGLHRWLLARLAGREGGPLLQPWFDLRRLLRKQTVLAETASAVTGHGLAFSVAATMISACLVPSFALGMAGAPLADLLVIVGLLMLARCSMALAAIDSGIASGGMAASRIVWLACLAGPAVLSVLFVAALISGSLNLDLIAAMQIENAADWRIATTIAFAALLVVAAVDTMPHDSLAQDFSGRFHALFEVGEALRLLVWFNLIGAMFLPFGMARADGGVLGWALGIVCWLARTLLFTVAFTIMRRTLGDRGARRATRALGIAALFGLLAAVFVFTGMRSA